MTRINSILIYGGSFDPIHNGHLSTAVTVQNHIVFDRVIFLPCKTPVLKKATAASCEQRTAMLKIALQDHQDFEIDLREMQRDTPSFMVDTLQSYRDELGPNTSITLLLGMDAFRQLTQWHDWEKLIKLSHLLVINRAKVNENHIDDSLKKLLLMHEVFDKKALLENTHGFIYRYNSGEYDISSTYLRQKILEKEASITDLPNPVYEYIKTFRLYGYSP